MNPKKLMGIAVAGAALIAVIAIVGPLISGGERMFAKVSQAVLANEFIQDVAGKPPIHVRQNDGPSEVEIDTSGRRNGFYSMDLTGSNGMQALKVYWRESTNGAVELERVYRSAPFKSDVLLWERKSK
jgi:hypothetical protein